MAVAGCIAVLSGCALVGNHSELSHSKGVALRSAEDARVFEAPQEQSYTLSSMRLESPKLPLRAKAHPDELNAEGSLVYADGMITELEVSGTSKADHSYSFMLTSPVVLRPNSAGGSNLKAVGKLTVDGVAETNFTIRVTPEFSDQHVRVRVSSDAPDQLSLFHRGDLSDDIVNDLSDGEPVSMILKFNASG